MQTFTHLTFIPAGVGAVLCFTPVTLFAFLIGVLLICSLLCQRLKRNEGYRTLRRIALFGFLASLLVIVIALPGLISIVWHQDDYWPIRLQVTVMGYATYAGLILSITLPFIFTRPISDESASPLHLRWMPLLTGALILTVVASIAVPVGGFAWMYPQHYHMITRQEEERAFNEYWSSVGANASTLDGTPRGTITGIGYERVIGERLKPLDALQEVEELEFADTGLRDADLTHLAHLSKLQVLNLKGTKITDRGMAELEALTNLKALDLSNTAVTDEGLKHIQGLRSLERIRLSNTRISDASINLLLDLPNLATLHIDGTDFSDDGIRALRAKLGEYHVIGEPFNWPVVQSP